MSFNFLKNNAFTIYELVIVSAIIAFLSAVGIPQYRKYKTKAMTSEAKLQLANAYLAESLAWAEYGTYVTCLDTIGYYPIAEESQRYYAIGFGHDSHGHNIIAYDSGAPLECKQVNRQCSKAGQKSDCYVYAAGKSAFNRPVITNFDGDGWSKATTGVLRVVAHGVISDKPLDGGKWGDVWYVNENFWQDKQFKHVRIGY